MFNATAILHVNQYYIFEALFSSKVDEIVKFYIKGENIPPQSNIWPAQIMQNNNRIFTIFTILLTPIIYNNLQMTQKFYDNQATVKKNVMRGRGLL